MNLILLLVLVIAAGAVLSVQAAINGRLGQTVGVLRSSLLTFAVGALSTALLIFSSSRRRLSACWMCRSGN